jgi:catechol 2,3-dioxygenase-like lactoylglutathione lyase family enzyme
MSGDPHTSAPPRLGLIILAVRELPRAVAFWREAFALVPRVEVPVYVELELPGGLALGLYERQGFGRNTGQLPAEVPPGQLSPTELYFRCEDLEGAIARLERLGARCLSPRAPRDWGDEAAYYADPDGNVVVVARELPRVIGSGQGLVTIRDDFDAPIEGVDPRKP